MTAIYPKTDQVLTAIGLWTQPLLEHPAFRQLVRSKIGSALDWEDSSPSLSERVSEVVLPEPLASQHEAVIQFYNLWHAAERLKSVEFYFRRYPFKDLPVGRHEHLENVCALFFSYFYVFQERLRVYLNALNAASSPYQIDVGKTLNLYQRRFKMELRERHGGTHFEPFDDLTINAVMLSSLRDGHGNERDRAGAIYAYRKASREWAKHAQQGSKRVAEFLEDVAASTLQVAAFLQTPPPTELYEITVK